MIHADKSYAISDSAESEMRPIGSSRQWSFNTLRRILRDILLPSVVFVTSLSKKVVFLLPAEEKFGLTVPLER